MEDKDLIRGDVAALLAIMAAMMEALDIQQPGDKQALAETLQKFSDGFPDQESNHSIKATLQAFNKVISKHRPLDSLFH